MTDSNVKAASQISDLQSEQDSGGVLPQKSDSVLLTKAKERAKRRGLRVNLRTLHGTARESARLYSDLANGKISQVEAEIRSRVLGRHKEILASLEQSQQLAAISAQLEAIRAPALPPAAEDGT